MEANVKQFIDMYHGSLDDTRDGYTGRRNIYYDASSGFGGDLVIPVDYRSGVIWDISASTDLASWSLYLFTKPGMISGASPSNAEMIAWTHHIIFASGTIGSRWYKYQHSDMVPIYFEHFDKYQAPPDDPKFSLYARVLGTNVGEFHMRLTLTGIS